MVGTEWEEDKQAGKAWSETKKDDLCEEVKFL